MTAPNGVAQQAVIREALRDAGVSAAELDYIEAHGTGTPLGDPIEVQALGEVMRERPLDTPAFLGSVKTNMGHPESAAGIAGLIKLVLSLRYGAIPPHLHFSAINPYIPIQKLPLRIPTVLTPWPEHDGTRKGGVSSFGFGGTNAHVVLEQAPASVPAVETTSRPLHILLLSARSDVALTNVAEQMEQYLSHADDGSMQ